MPVASRPPPYLAEAREPRSPKAPPVLLWGALLAPVLTFTPLLRYMGWFLRSLVHEMGHTAVAWLFGCPAFPAIRLDGHAAAVHGNPSFLLALVAWAGLAGMAWKRRGPWIALAVAYPLVAFTRARELSFLLAGHSGELAFALYGFRAALGGGISGRTSERVAHAAVAFYLAGANVYLAGGLLFSPGMRRGYAESGSFGLTNDYLRVSREIFHGPLQAVAAGMLLLSLAVLSAPILLRRAADPRNE